jgi:hypothetical protein
MEPRPLTRETGRGSRAPFYVIIGAVVVASVLVGLVIPSPSTHSTLPPPLTILPSGDRFTIPQGSNFVTGPENLTNSSKWVVNWTFSADSSIDLFTLNATQFQLWNLSARGLPAQYSLALEDSTGATGYDGLLAGTYYYLWMNASPLTAATVTIDTFVAHAVQQFPPVP